MTTAHYTTHGSVRGGCGHKHRTIEAAGKCQQSDQAGCKSQGGYSDRSVVLIRDGIEFDLSEAEYACLTDFLTYK